MNVPLEDEEKTNSKQPTFAERRIETEITRSGFYKWEYVHSAEAVDVATGIRAKAKSNQKEVPRNMPEQISRPNYWSKASSAKIEQKTYITYMCR